MSFFVKTEEAARILGISKSHLYRNWRQLSGSYCVGRNLRWNVDELAAHMRRQATQEDPQTHTPQGAGHGVFPQLKTLITREEYECLQEAKKQLEILKRVLNKQPRRRPFPIALGSVNAASAQRKTSLNS